MLRRLFRLNQKFNFIIKGGQLCVEACYLCATFKMKLNFVFNNYIKFLI